ncbi:MAG: DNA methyltransferase [Dehalococcoidia bacterium]
MSSVAPLRPAGAVNRLQADDRSVHDWYRFVLSFPPHLVRDYLGRFGVDGRHRVLDPFCGTGTVGVECRKLGIAAVGVEANPMTHLAARVKTDWSPDPDGLVAHAQSVATAAEEALALRAGEEAPGQGGTGAGRSAPSPPEAAQLLPAGAISPLPLHKTLVLLERIQAHADRRYGDHERLALARVLVTVAGNLRFGPEVSVGPAKPDAPVVAAWLGAVEAMARDLRAVGRGVRPPARCTTPMRGGSTARWRHALH